MGLQGLTRADVENIARKAGEAAGEAAAVVAVQRFAALLGVDVSDVKSVNELRADLIAARSMRRMRERLAGRIFVVVITAAALGVGTIFGDGVAARIKDMLR